jgi:CubicO group peptidase (beta-lactamase class C family)
MKFPRWLVLSFVLTLTGLLLIAPVSARQAIPLDTAAIDAQVEALMADYEVPGLGLAVVRDGETIYARGYGVRDLATGAPTTADTQFSIGSITKSFTALAAAQLVDAGRLDLDAPLTAYLPDFALSEALPTPALTMRHLLSNTAGFTPEDSAWYSGDLTTLDEAVAYIGTLPVPAWPGAVYAYNNLGFALAGYALQTVAGQPYAELIESGIFAPLGMTEASLSFDAMQQTPDYSAPHGLDVRAGVIPIPYFPHMAAIAPAGAINASATEMARYAIMQLNEGQFEGAQVVSAEGVAEMHTAQLDGYGLGWVIGEHAGYATVWHNGSIDGYGALLLMIPEAELGVVGLMNADYLDNVGFLDALVLRVAEIALGVEPEADIVATLQAQTGLDPLARRARLEAARAFVPDPANYAAYVGEYASFIGPFSLALRDESLWANIVQAGTVLDFELIEFEPGKFIGNGRGLLNSVFELRPGRQNTLRVFQDGIPVGERSLE